MNTRLGAMATALSGHARTKFPCPRQAVGMAPLRRFHGPPVSLAAIVISFAITLGASRADETNAGAQQPIADGETGILVLQDGGVLTGEITRVADWYLVSRGSGQMQVAESRVLLLCRTLHEAYEFKRQQTSGDKPADHLRLAEWCMRYELRDAAARELAEARRLDPDLPRLALLERRLEKGGSLPKAKESVYLAHANSRAKPPLDQARERQAAAVLPQTVAAQTSPPQSTQAAGDLPDGVVELFTRKVQPVLVNNCTVSGCHQSGGKQSFQLDRAILRGESNRRTTMRNLEAALALIDREHPDQSPLLTIPRRTHGGMNGPIYGPRQEAAYKHLVDWVAVVVPPKDEDATPDGDANQAEPSNEPARTAARPMRANAKATATSAGPLQSQSRPNTDVQTASATDLDLRPTLKQPHRLQVGAQQLKPWQPRDEFDPEIFNRAQRARTQVGTPAAQSAQSSGDASAPTAAPR